jgi:hypothetical protein
MYQNKKLFYLMNFFWLFPKKEKVFHLETISLNRLITIFLFEFFNQFLSMKTKYHSGSMNKWVKFQLRGLKLGYDYARDFKNSGWEWERIWHWILKICIWAAFLI